VNWLDWTIIAFFAFALIGGFRDGFVRLVIGMAALAAGFIFAAWFYGLAADSLLPWVTARPLANLLGFALILCGTIAAGCLLSSLIARLFKLAGLSFVDRALGGAFALVRAAFILAVITMALMAFAPKWMPRAVRGSTIAPYMIEGADVLTAATPFELKRGFAEALDEVQGMMKGLRPKKLIVRQE
jgi:membrane protein required for colicin V production